MLLPILAIESKAYMRLMHTVECRNVRLGMQSKQLMISITADARTHLT